MNWVRDFGMQEAAQPAHTVEDATENKPDAFVRRTLILTRAGQYRAWKKDPSRFLAEMGVAA